MDRAMNFKNGQNGNGVSPLDQTSILKKSDQYVAHCCRRLDFQSYCWCIIDLGGPNSKQDLPI